MSKQIEKPIHTKTITLPDGRTISLETGRLAKQSDGSVVLQMGDTMILATVVSDKEPKDIPFLPLTVNYQEQYAAAGRFPGGFVKREGRLSNYEIVVSRLIDRALRPLFPDGYANETQVLISLISADKNVMPDSLAGLAASAALTLSDVPFGGPIAEVRVARIQGELVINPHVDQLEHADLDIIVAGTEGEINMVEGEMEEISEQEMVEALKFAHESIQQQCRTLKEFEAEAGYTEKRELPESETTEDEETIRKEADAYLRDRIYEVAKNPSDKAERSQAFNDVLHEYLGQFGEEELEAREAIIKDTFGDLKKEVVRNMILNEGKRLDGRGLTDIRDIDVAINYLPSVHGSAVFTRGETQSLTSVTLGSSLDRQMIDGVMFETYEKFILHYNFPPFSTGEVKPVRGPGRREIGHGHLAERSLRKVMPPDEENPYTVRVVSDILESNGSSSMATVCAGSLALMDSGIKTKSPVAGIAMGLIKGEGDAYAILSDILGDEDHLGDMDFKVAGTQEGITACQMDLKVEGLSYDILEEALLQAREGRLHILSEMSKVIDKPREDFKSFAPRIEKLHIEKDNIGTVIGPGGKQIQDLQETTGAHISLNEVDGYGVVEISAENKDSLDMAKQRIQKLIEVPEVGKVYTGKVKTIMNFGAFIEFLPGKDGLLHISEIAWEKTESMDGIFEEGQEVQVKLKDIDAKTGKFALTMKELYPKPEGYTDKPPKKKGPEGAKPNPDQ
jgi:polyribonucleotide nucleotidyltransferase